MRLILLNSIMLLPLILSPTFAAEKSGREIIDSLIRKNPRDKAIGSALEWMDKQQNPDGSLGEQHKTAMTSLGLMSYLASGITFDNPERGKMMLKSLSYVLSQQDKSGYFGAADSSKMYGHGMATLMLAEAIGMTGDEKVEEKVRIALEKAVAVTVAAAKVKKGDPHSGGWRYAPSSTDSDMSLSGWQLMSLHAAQQVGIDVPEEIIAAAFEYVKSNTGKDGKVGYQSRNESSKALRGMGMLCFSICGHDDSELVSATGELILKEKIQWSGQRFFYRAYYDAVGMSRARPEMWEKYGPHLAEVLITNQKKDGSWPSPPGSTESQFGGVFMTSMAVLALAVDRHILPAYQR